MKARFFLLDGDTNASSRQRVLQFLPYLRDHGMQTVVSRPVPESMYQRLVERRGSARGGSKVGFYGLFMVCRLFDVLRANPDDIVVIQRDLFPFGPPLLERLLARRSSRLVYDTDDATYLRPAFTPNTPFQRLRRFDKVAEVVSTARWVSAATAPIATWARQYNHSVSVVPMAVDLAAYDSVRAASPRRPERLVLGWAGTAGGLRYLEALAPMLREVCLGTGSVVRVISGGYRDVRLPGVPVEARPWRAATALADMRGFHIGLVPLDDTPFERAKFPFKLLQYLALGVPALSARVGVACEVIEHGRNGLLALTPREWQAGLEALIADADLRTRLASAGRQTVAAHYTIQRVAPLLLDGLSLAAR
ncbi:MAG: glycosyltransferase family 4 protein [Chloroflexota bacterium]|nr:glycosyltransferase family 4 protein [Chloroflexota bacterium]